MMLKLTVRDILRQKSFGTIAIISGFLLGLVYYFLTLSSAVNHNLIVLVVSPQYLAASIGLTLVVAVLGGINIALVVYNIKTQRMNLQKGGRQQYLVVLLLHLRQDVLHVQHRLLQFWE